MRLSVLGLSHKTAPVAVREALAVPTDALPRLLARARALPDVAEAMVVSTCNRVELFVVPTGRSHDLKRVLGDLLCATRGADPALLDGQSYYYEGRDAVLHLLRVTASLDSMVVGEPQILGQIKEAVSAARHEGALGPVLDRLTARAFHAAKRARSETAIAENRVSIGSVAVDLARRIFARMDEVKVLLVGAGKMGETTARSLASAGAARVYICNRSHERAFQLAERHGWRARAFSELTELLAEADIVLTSTGSARPIIDKKMLKKVIKTRKYRPLFLVDIAVPRDVAPDVSELETVYLYNVDDLEAISRDNMQSREQEAEAAESLVEAELTEIDNWFQMLEVQPTLKAIRARAHAVADEEVERTFAKRLAHLGPKERKAVEKMMKATMSKLLHPTMIAIKDGAAEGGAASLVATARRLFGIPEDEPSEDEGAKAPPADAVEPVESTEQDPELDPATEKASGAVE